MSDRYDVVILGGGLAGLTLARQLRQERADLRLLVVERRPHPVPEAAFKVGESTVEIGARYFGHVLGLAPHMAERQLDKFGLRYFFADGSNRDVAQRYELGARRFPRVTSYQIDRGRLENHLFEENGRQGIEQVAPATATTVSLGEPHHVVTYAHEGIQRSVEARWVVDASGRCGLLKRQLGLRETVGHRANAAWFRVRSRLRVDDWSNDPEWHARVKAGCRWLSTNHLMGPGYWVWLIPLASDSTSVGIVCDADMHPYGTLNRLDKALEWLDRHEPQCADVVRAEAEAGRIEDFLGLQHYAHGCRQVYSTDRWCLTGEAGVFTDPFYSPGSDFIAISNDLITEMILREREGGDIRRHALVFNHFYLRLFEAYLKVYENQYPIMGSARVMTAKVAWDNACYWGVTALLYFQRAYRDITFLQAIEAQMRRFFLLHVRMQEFLRAWHAADTSRLGRGFANVIDVDLLRGWQDGLDAGLDRAGLLQRLDENLTTLEQFAAAIRALPQTMPDPADQRTIIPELSTVRSAECGVRTG
ncbi:MAG TPA: tryptophan 7-halogenase [Vicinamibacterales bacterium]